MGHILVVDDERSIRITVKAFLEDDGHAVDTAEDADSALAIFDAKPIDVILTDIILPRLSGVELLRHIRAKSAHVQVIMMTGEPTLETASESLRLGAMDYLQKPVGKNEVLNVVRNALNVKYLSDEKLRLEKENQHYVGHLEELVRTRTKALTASEAALRQRAQELEASLARIEEGEAERLALLQHLQRSQKMEAIGTLASGIAHDFNNILAAMIGYTELALLDTPTKANSRENLEMVLTAGERARELVKQILTFSRKNGEERKPIQIVHTVREVLKFMRASLPATIAIREDIDANIGNILAEPVQIHQVIMNLCTNAQHAMQETGGVLAVSLTEVNLGPDYGVVNPDLKPGPYVRLVVKDTGHGMDEATMAKIFDPYFTTKAKGLGTGLGLAVTHGIVQKHGGAVTVESESGKGSTFTLYFPAIQKQEAGATRPKEEIPTGHGHILLVDDEQILVEVSRRVLERLGYRVDTRTSSMDALALFRAHPNRYDLVITDMTMPNMTGDKLALQLLQIREDLPIVLCTGYSENILEERAKAIGIKALIRKPIRMAEIAKAIREALVKE